MRQQRIYEEAMRRVARRATGSHPLAPRRFVGQNADVNLEHELWPIPEIVDDRTILQKADGSFYFMAGFSAVSGADEVM